MSDRIEAMGNPEDDALEAEYPFIDSSLLGPGAEFPSQPGFRIACDVVVNAQGYYVSSEAFTAALAAGEQPVYYRTNDGEDGKIRRHAAILESMPVDES
ncbi:MAG TPA: hypothetical protein PKL83_00930 [bacterium]|nr:hypothetical protein [bacterium]